MFYGMMQFHRVSDWTKLGGWTQTSSKPSPLVVMQNTQAKRQLLNRCFDCGQSHHAGHPSCKGSNLNCFYNCVSCKQRNDISSRGASTPHLDDKAAKGPASSFASVRQPVATAAAVIARAQQAEPCCTPSTRKRPAAEISEKTFEDCWGNEKVRKKGHYACVKDFLRAMDTDKAKSALPTVQERLKTMARKKNWPSNAHKTFPEFSSGGGGGSHGVGATKTAMRDIYVDRGGHLK